MFQEKEEGQPKRWGFLVACIIIVFSLSVLVVVIIRILLDSEDEINMPLIQGKLREDLTYFLGVFTMTFFFGCWCCFCCACSCCKWCVYQFPYKMMQLWKAIPNIFVDNLDHLPIHRYRETDETSSHEGIVIEHQNTMRPKQLPQHSDRRAYENPGYIDMLEMNTVQSPRLILPPAPNGRLRSQSIDISPIV